MVTVHGIVTRTAFMATEDRLPPQRFLSLTRRVQVEPGKTYFKPYMAWRPYENLIDGELDNRTPGSVRGWMRFHRRGKKPLRVVLDLAGDFHEDIRGKVIRLSNPNPSEKNERLEREGTYMEGISPVQQGDVGDITAGLPLGLAGNEEPSYAYAPYPYIEWYGANGRMVLELDPSQVEIVDGTRSLKVPPSARDYQTEADMIQRLASLFERPIQFPFDEPEVS